MALWTKKNLTRIFPAYSEKVYVLLILDSISVLSFCWAWQTQNLKEIQLTIWWRDEQACLIDPAVQQIGSMISVVFNDQGLWSMMSCSRYCWPVASVVSGLPESRQFWIFTTLSAFFPHPPPHYSPLSRYLSGGAPMPFYHTAYPSKCGITPHWNPS